MHRQAKMRQFGNAQSMQIIKITIRSPEAISLEMVTVFLFLLVVNYNRKSKNIPSVLHLIDYVFDLEAQSHIH